MRFALPAAVVLALGLAGCSWTPSATKLTVSSVNTPAVFSPAFETGVYRRIDQNSADIFVTDLSVARLADPSDPLQDAAGSILHIHMFLVPAAGKTPIDRTACNATVRHIVLSGGAVGIYGGAGFFYPGGTPGDLEFGGVLDDASLRLARASKDFNDLLKSAVAQGDVRATLDEKAARAIAARIDALANVTPQVETKK